MNYNVKTETVIRYPYLERVDAAIVNDANQWYHYLRDVLSKGCQAAIEISDPSTGEVDYSTGIIMTPPSRSGQASGSFAQVKMDTLKKCPKLVMTGIWSLSELIDEIHRIRPSYNTQTFSRLENVCQLTREHQEELRREIGITNYLGGIRIPFTRSISSSESGGRKTEHKELCITFSALSGEGDLNMCFQILRGMQQALQSAEPNVTYHFDLSGLKQYQTAHFQIVMKGISEDINK